MSIIIKAFVILILTFNTSYAGESVKASWYDCVKKNQCSRHKITASGEKFNPNGLTAAHKTLPFGTKVLVEYKGRKVVVRINDRGPYVKGRKLDLSRAAARKIGCKGVCKVKMSILNLDKK